MTVYWILFSGSSASDGAAQHGLQLRGNAREVVREKVGGAGGSVPCADTRDVGGVKGTRPAQEGETVVQLLLAEGGDAAQIVEKGAERRVVHNGNVFSGGTQADLPVPLEYKGVGPAPIVDADRA